MAHDINRRKALAAGTAATGALFGMGCGGDAQKNTTPAKAEQSFLPESGLWAWSPPADIERDLTPGTSAIRLAAFTHEYMVDYRPGDDMGEVVRTIRKAGYTSTNSSIAQRSRNAWLDAPQSEVDSFKAALKEYDVTYFDVHAYLNNIHPDMEMRRRNWKHCAEQCEVAERLGVPMVTTQTGSCSPISAITIHRDNWTEETWKTSVEAITQILKDTEGMNVALGIEALNLINVNNPRAHRRLMDEIGDPRVKVCLDPTNMICLATYGRTSELINECFAMLGEDIIAAHAKDSLVLPNKMSAYLTQTLPGTGVLDYELYLAQLSRLEKPRTLIIEHLAPEQYPEAKRFIEETASRIGVTIYGS